MIEMAAMTRPARLPLCDTTVTYGLITRLLHWSIAALLLWQFTGMGLRLLLGRQPIVSFFVGSHQPVGTVLFALIALRILWALSMRHRRPPHGAGLVGLAARLGHFALYAMMLVVPGAALLRAFGQTRAFAPFGFELFPAREVPLQWMVDLGDLLHGEIAWLLSLLILGHIAMVIVHERVWRDRTLTRMTGRHPG